MSSGAPSPTETPIRVFHHWACSGGTLLSRCLAIHPHVVLLSEVHPLAYLRLQSPEHYFSPTDLIQQLCLPHNGRDPAACVATWNGAIDALNMQLMADQKVLVLRSHSHVDFFTGILPAEEPFVSRALAPRHRLLQLLSVRHPLDSWLSLCQQGWDRHFCFSSFSEFCNRCLAMLEACRGMGLIRYEDFCLDPRAGLALMAQALELELEPVYLEQLEEVKLSGDSGRTHSVIGCRPRRPVPPDLLAHLADQLTSGALESPYLKLCLRLGYDPEPAKDPFTSMQPLDPLAVGPIGSQPSEPDQLRLEQHYFDRYHQQARDLEAKARDLEAKARDLEVVLADARAQFQQQQQELSSAQAELGELRHFERQARHSYKTLAKLIWAETVSRCRRMQARN